MLTIMMSPSMDSLEFCCATEVAIVPCMDHSLLSPGLEGGEKTSISAELLYNNFLLFSTSFSLVHATVDGVLVYATAELGPLLGGISGGLLYICYAFSSLFLAKNILHHLKSRRAVLLGMTCLLTYVSTFLMALVVPDIKWIVCIIGSIVGGCGAGIMWTAQGSYYALNSSLHLMAVSREHEDSDINCASAPDRGAVLNKFASYFAAIYLCSEAACKMLVTAMFLIFSDGGDDDEEEEDESSTIGSWQVIAFSAFTFVAWTATGFSFWILDLTSIKEALDAEVMPKKSDTVNDSVVDSTDAPTAPTLSSLFVKDFSSVLAFIIDHESFCYLLPYQFSFGLCSTYMGFLVFGIILNDNGKEGYIGLLSALSILYAGVLAIPVTLFTNRKDARGSSAMSNVHIVMVTGAAIFVACSILPLFLSDQTVASWPAILPLVCTYGAGRSIWENSNKALIAALFAPAEEEAGEDPGADLAMTNSFRQSLSSMHECTGHENSPLIESCHEKAFAAIYFTSGAGAAVGFFTFKFLSSSTIAGLTAGGGLVALFSNHYFFTFRYEKINKT